MSSYWIPLLVIALVLALGLLAYDRSARKL